MPQIKGWKLKNEKSKKSAFSTSILMHFLQILHKTDFKFRVSDMKLGYKHIYKQFECCLLPLFFKVFWRPIFVNFPVHFTEFTTSISSVHKKDPTHAMHMLQPGTLWDEKIKEKKKQISVIKSKKTKITQASQTQSWTLWYKL